MENFGLTIPLAKPALTVKSLDPWGFWKKKMDITSNSSELVNGDPRTSLPILHTGSFFLGGGVQSLIHCATGEVPALWF